VVNVRPQYEDAERIAREITARAGYSAPAVPDEAVNAQELGGIPASSYQLVLARADRLAQLGIWVGATPPASPITYAQWLTGVAGHWSWITT
jgi:hypothetical protein